MLPVVTQPQKVYVNLNQNVCITVKKWNDYSLIFKGAQNKKYFSVQCAIGWKNQG